MTDAGFGVEGLALLSSYFEVTLRDNQVQEFLQTVIATIAREEEDSA
jgi:hypothetical protein